MRVTLCFLQLFKAGESVHELIELNKSCSSHIASLVDLQWSLVTGGRCGKASLHGISLSLAMLDIVRTSPFTWGNCTLPPHLSTSKC